MKKTLSIFLSLMLALCLALGACGKESPATSQSKDDSLTSQSKDDILASQSKEDSFTSAESSEDSLSNEPESTESTDISNGQSADTSTEVSDETSSEVSAEEPSIAPATGKSLSFKAKYISTWYDSSKSLPYAVVIDSSAELTSYYLNNKNACGLGDDYKKAISSYDVEFFANKTLIMVACREGSGSIRHEVSKAVLIDYDGRKWLNLEIKRLVPSTGTENEAGWHIIIELDKECLEAKDNIAINMIEA